MKVPSPELVDIESTANLGVGTAAFSVIRLAMLLDDIKSSGVNESNGKPTDTDGTTLGGLEMSTKGTK